MIYLRFQSVIVTAFALMSARSQGVTGSADIIACASGKLKPAVAEGLKNFLKNSKPGIQEFSQVDLARQRTVDLSIPKSDRRSFSVTRDSIHIEFFDAVHEPGAPVIIYYHPGGFVLPLLPWMDNMAWRISKTYGAIVFAVDYRVPPKYPYPAATNDCYAAFQWITKHAAEFGGDAKKIMLFGQSAGATLAAVTAQKAVNAGQGNIIKLQILECPSTDHVDNNSNYVSHQLYDTGYLPVKSDFDLIKKSTILSRGRKISRSLLSRQETFQDFHQLW